VQFASIQVRIHSSWQENLSPWRVRDGQNCAPIEICRIVSIFLHEGARAVYVRLYKPLSSLDIQASD
jgi:hypothetical protein